MTWEGDTDTHPWVRQSGPIHLRHSEHKPEPVPAGGILLWALVGAVLLLFGYAAWRWLGA